MIHTSEIEKGRKAQEILDSAVFKEAEEMARQQVMEDWTNEATAQGREALWHLIQNLSKGANPVRRALATLAGRGSFAAHTQDKEK